MRAPAKTSQTTTSALAVVQGGQADAGVVGADPDPGAAGQRQVLADEVGERLVDLHDALPRARAGSTAT